MAFSENTVKQAWIRSGGRCECQRLTHRHELYARCAKLLLWNQRGNDGSIYGWEAHHKIAESKGGSNTFDNCEILCMDCHKMTDSFGRH